MEKNQKIKLIYALPNLFTAASLFSAIYSIISAINSDFIMASWFIIISLLLDGLDGRVARMTNTSSKFGMEFDSLADIVSFGVAPALLVYLYIGNQYGKIGIVISALFVVLGAIRLARFNIMTESTEPSVFIGIPIPAAAVLLSVTVMFMEMHDLQKMAVALLPLSIFVALLMVSNIRYPSFKKIKLEKKDRIKVLVTAIIMAVTLYIYPAEGFILLFTVYLLSGPVRLISIIIKKSNKKETNGK